MQKRDSKYLRKNSPRQGELKSIKRNPIYFVLDNVLDTYNIGSLFRLADAVAAEKIYICGSSEYPPSSKIHKAAVGTEEWVSWEKRNSALETVKELKKENLFIIAIEQNSESIDYSKLNNHLKLPAVLIVGHETHGISKEILKETDLIVEIPMFGINKSLNVWGAAAIVSYKIIESIHNP